jgi:HAD superfamily hydrolase (TIGR01549 family)
MAAFEFFPGVKELLLELRGKYKLVVITNGPAFSQHPKLVKVSMKEYVDHIIVGGDEPEEKPCASIFEKALALVDASPSEVIHIGDSLTSDIDGANQMGIKSVWIAPNDSENGTTIIPTHRLASILDLHKVLREAR